MNSPRPDTFSVIGGQFISDRIERIVLAIKEYEPDIDVKWVPPPREPRVAAFKVVYAPVGKHPFTLFHVNTEEEFDERVLQRIIVNDQRNGEVKLSDFEAWEATQLRIEHQRFLDAMEEKGDIAAHVFKSHLNTYKVNDDLIIKEGIPFNAARLKD